MSSLRGMDKPAVLSGLRSQNQKYYGEDVTGWREG